MDALTLLWCPVVWHSPRDDGFVLFVLSQIAEKLRQALGRFPVM